MSIDMSQDIMAELNFGKAALKKLAPIAENFRFYEAGWMGNKQSEWTVMRVTGAEFREAKAGPHKGKLSVLVKGTKRTAFVTKEEMLMFD